MDRWTEIQAAVEAGELDGELGRLYPSWNLEKVRDRIHSAAEGFQGAFHPAPEAPGAFFSAPGRVELGGNHTDHQRGHVLCAGVEADLLACAAANGTGRLRLRSPGFSPVEVDLADLTPRAEERGTSAALVRGVAAALRARGLPLAGFDAWVDSQVPPGLGLSSSAAYEVLVGIMLDQFSPGGGGLPPREIARAGQYAENVYFGKPCGGMDQMASALGGVLALDFGADPGPAVKRIEGGLGEKGYLLCVVDTGSAHEDLTAEYAAIPREMGRVAACFGKSVLREVPEREFRNRLCALRESCGDRAVLRAMHFYGEDRRAQEMARALEAGDVEEFAALAGRSGLSSDLCLQNTRGNQPRNQAVALALALGRELAGQRGTVRVHGGGFAGTILAVLPRERLEPFRNGMEEVFGSGAVRVLRIRDRGGCLLGESCRDGSGT